jgi:hypothetical protein
VKQVLHAADINPPTMQPDPSDRVVNHAHVIGCKLLLDSPTVTYGAIRKLELQ